MFSTTGMQVCRVCLASNTKLYNMDDYSLKTSYEALTNCDLADDDLPRNLCWECAARLKSCMRFRHKAIRSQSLLALTSHRYGSMQQLLSIDRQEHNLTSTLVCNHFNHYNLHLIESSEPDLLTQEPIQEININEVKSDLDVESSSDEVLAKKKVKKSKKRKKDEQPKIDRRRKPASEVLNEALFTITDLTFEQQIEEIRKRKDTSNYKNSVYKCDDCFKGFLDEDAYNSHVFRHTDESGTFVCEVCKTHFKHQHALRNHAVSHVQQFSCKCCPYITTRRHAAKLHEDWHNGTRYQCPHCQEDFTKFSTYMGHIRIKHPSDWVCALCGHSFVSEKGLSLHKKLKHRSHQQPIPENGPYCARCDVRFASQEALDQHTRLSARHDADKKDNGRRGRREGECERDGKTRRPRPDKPEGPIPCEQCDMQLPDSLSYYRHFRRAHPDKNRTNYPSMKTKCMCEVCGKMFQTQLPDSLSFNRHFRRAHPAKNRTNYPSMKTKCMCEVCGKMFQSLALLRDHSSTHTDAKQFKCGQCDKTFQRQYRLIAHRRLHRGARAAHACGTCGKRFTTASNRQRHMFSHTGLKPFKCEMCGKSFKHASEKRAHITYVHLKKPWPKRARGKKSDNRQVQQPLPIELDLQPLWPAGDPKIATEKPMYLL